MQEIIMATSSKQSSPELASRLKAQIRIYYGPAQKTILSDYSVDLSIGGLYLSTSFPFKTNQSLTLCFSLPDQPDTVKCKARVAWINQGENLCKPELPAGIGVKFVDLSSENLASLSSYLNLEANW
ncbi:MAG: hypothetical protein C0614_05080 [Desulfuromonas sp.]|nr:MAG: hypothetical protein C0614_05080 [Desulfuromonas sp.]